MPPKTSAQRKFFRGVEQVKQLLSEAEAFESRGAYVFRTEVESRSTHEITYRCFAVEREPPPEEWPLLAGEAIQNLRAALDHIVFEASGRQSGAKFPIFTDLGKFQQKAPGMLQGVPTQVAATIEKAQPYRSFPPDPAQAMLEQLVVLSNRDKHRILATIASAVVREGVGLSKGVSVTWGRYGTGRRLGSGETDVSTFTASSDAPLGEEDVEPMLGYEVRIEGRRLDVLKGIVHDIYPVLFECETRQPLSPFATYPL